MKKITLIIILLISLFEKGNAQDVKFYPNPNLDKFVGTWIAEKNNKTVTIILEKTKVTHGAQSYEIIEGRHIYKVGNTILENPQEVTLKVGSTISYSAGANTPNQLHFNFYDIEKKKGGDATLTISPDTPNVAKWALFNTEGLRVNKKAGKEFDKTFTLPRTMIFKKQ